MTTENTKYFKKITNDILTEILKRKTQRKSKNVDEFKRELDYVISTILTLHKEKNKNISNHTYNWCTSSWPLNYDENSQQKLSFKIGINLTVFFNVNNVNHDFSYSHNRYNTNIIFHTYNVDEVLNTTRLNDNFDRARIEIK